MKSWIVHLSVQKVYVGHSRWLPNENVEQMVIFKFSLFVVCFTVDFYLDPESFPREMLQVIGCDHVSTPLASGIGAAALENMLRICPAVLYWHLWRFSGPQPNCFRHCSGA